MKLPNMYKIKNLLGKKDEDEDEYEPMPEGYMRTRSSLRFDKYLEARESGHPHEEAEEYAKKYVEEVSPAFKRKI